MPVRTRRASPPVPSRKECEACHQGEGFDRFSLGVRWRVLCDACFERMKDVSPQSIAFRALFGLR